jgi:hypothetical protein
MRQRAEEARLEGRQFAGHGGPAPVRHEGCRI